MITRLCLRFPLLHPNSGSLAVIALALAALPAWSQEISGDPLRETTGKSTGEPPAGFLVPVGDSPRISPAPLPADAQSLVSQFEQQQAAIRQEAEQKVQAERENLIQKLKQLQDRYTRDAKLEEAVAIRDRIRQLQAYSATQPAGVSSDPGTLSAFGGRVGDSFVFLVTGSTTGRVWGTDHYTTDSRLAVAAVHGGVLEPGQPGMVRVTILPGQSSYKGTARHGVTSDSWGSWAGSYRVEPASGSTTSPASTDARPDRGSLRTYRDKIGQTFDFEVVGATQGTIWGTDVYTDDSPLATAAVHAGIIAPRQSGAVRVTILPGRSNYTGSTRHGITSYSYGQWEGSYSLAPVVPQSASPGSQATPPIPRDVPGATPGETSHESSSGPTFTDLGNGVAVPSTSIGTYAEEHGVTRAEARERLKIEHDEQRIEEHAGTYGISRDEARRQLEHAARKDTTHEGAGS